MTRTKITFGALLIFAATALALASSCSGPGGPGSEPSPAGTADGTASSEQAAGADLVWEEDWQQAFARAATEHRMVVAAFRADWCIWCHRMEQGTFTEPEVTTLLADHAVMLRLDIDHNGSDQVAPNDVRTLPTVIAFAPDGTELGRITGYARPKRFLASARSWLKAEG